MFNNELWQKPAGGAGGDFYSYQIANSIFFNGTSQALERSFSSAASDDDKKALSFWIKRSGASGTNSAFGSTTNTKLCSSSTGNGAVSDMLEINTNNPTGYSAQFHYYLSSGGSNFLKAKWRDPSAWMHIVWIYNSDESTTTDRLKVYINGESNTINDSNYWDNDGNNGYPSSGADTSFGKNGNEMHIGRYVYDDAGWWGGQMADFIMIDGAASISDFGELKNGVWIPKNPSGLTFGNNGFHLNFADASAPGNDVSGNNNDFTNVGSIPASAQTTDSPTFNSDSNGGNFMTYNGAYIGANNALAEGNLKSTGSSGGNTSGTFGMLTGKWYWECRAATVSAYGPTFGIGQSGIGNTDGQYNIITWQTSAGQMYGGGGIPLEMGTISVTSTGVTSLSSGDIMSFWLDCDNRKLWIGKNGTIPNSGNVATGANPQASWATTPTDRYFTATCQNVSSSVGVLNAGQNPSFNGAITAGTNTDKNGYGLFKYDPSGTDFVACCAANIPTADAVDPAQTNNYPQKLFGAKTYTGTGSSNALTGVGFKPDWTWIKERGGANDHKLTDSTRGVTKSIESNDDAAQTTDSNGLTAFGTDGFTVGSDAVYNNSSDTYVGWNWRANGGTTASNGNGSITSTVQADPSGSFSIVSYTGYDSTWDNMSTVGHGLSSAPDCILLKPLTHIPWEVFFGNLGGTGGGSTAAGNSLVLNSTAALYTNQTYRTWGDVMPTSTVFTVNGNNANAAGVAMIAYCFANTEGYIKSGSYEGNGNVDGTFVYTGFRPALIMTKSLDSTSDWQIFDDKRVGYNVDNNELQANEADAEVTTDMIDILSNGFKMRIATDPNVAETYVYLALAKNPFKYATAR